MIIPLIPFKGVRISWLICLKKSVFALFAFSACFCASFAFFSAILAFWSNPSISISTIKKTDTTSTVKPQKLSLINSFAVTFFRLLSYIYTALENFEADIVFIVLFRTDSSMLFPRLTANDTIPYFSRKTLCSLLSSEYCSNLPESIIMQSAFPLQTAFFASFHVSYSFTCHCG